MRTKRNPNTRPILPRTLKTKIQSVGDQYGDSPLITINIGLISQIDSATPITSMDLGCQHHFIKIKGIMESSKSQIKK